jgi:hypothetical protein
MAMCSGEHAPRPRRESSSSEVSLSLFLKAFSALLRTSGVMAGTGFCWSVTVCLLKGKEMELTCLCSYEPQWKFLSSKCLFLPCLPCSLGFCLCHYFGRIAKFFRNYSAVEHRSARLSLRR